MIRELTPSPPWWLLLLVVFPVMTLVEVLSRIPQFLVVAGMFATTTPIPRAGIAGILLWFSNPGPKGQRHLSHQHPLNALSQHCSPYSVCFPLFRSALPLVHPQPHLKEGCRALLPSLHRHCDQDPLVQTAQGIVSLSLSRGVLLKSLHNRLFMILTRHSPFAPCSLGPVPTATGSGCTTTCSTCF